ncbi:hypothetical protein NDU88_008252, partial [Pleurodeles waltl]
DRSEKNRRQEAKRFRMTLHKQKSNTSSSSKSIHRSIHTLHIHCQLAFSLAQEASEGEIPKCTSEQPKSKCITSSCYVERLNRGQPHLQTVQAIQTSGVSAARTLTASNFPNWQITQVPILRPHHATTYTHS